MVDNYQNNDEYEFTDLDALNTDPLNVNEGVAQETTYETRRQANQNNIRRNALIAVSIVILAMLAYKFFGSFFTTKVKAPDSALTAPPVKQPIVVKQEPIVEPTPTVVTSSQPAPSTSPSATEQELTQRVSALELSQQSLRSDLNGVSEQLGGLNTSISELSSKINSLTESMAVLTQKVEEQATQIAVLTERTKPKPVVVRHLVKKVIPQIVYYIQAVIPGRAWLIGSNGSTLTVREGTMITGYGIVRLIDAHQGRVLTSSGRIIRFSPQDS